VKSARRRAAPPGVPQMSLFENLPVELPPRRTPIHVDPPAEITQAPRDHIQRPFARFHRENPQVYEKLVYLAHKVKATGRKRYGIGSLFERLRWHYHIEMNRPDSEFKLNNNYRSRYARLIMQTEPDLGDFFDLRVLAIDRR